MNFNVTIGNPPYQQDTKDTSDKPIYHLFYDAAFKITDKDMLISPARFLYDAGKTPSLWNKEMLDNKHLKVIWVRPVTKVFDNVDIKGGITVIYRDMQQDYGAITHYISSPIHRAIFKKVTEYDGFKSIDNILHLQNKFNLEALYADYPECKAQIGSNGNERRLTTNIFRVETVFTMEPRTNSDIKILGLVNNTRQYRYINKKYIATSDNLDKFKVVMPKTNGTGTFGEEISSPMLEQPNEGITQSFISFGSFNTAEEAEAALKYIKTKFARTMLGVLKITQDNNTEVWKYVPLQNFTPDSDIDWSKSVADIDQQLYAKYGLTQEERDFIERMVKPME